MSASVDGRTLAGTRMTPDQRRERARRAYLAGAIATIVKRAPELTEEQIEKLRSVLSGGTQ